MISPSAANCWTPWRKLVNRGPKQRPPRTSRWSIAAVSLMTSLVSGGHFCDCAWQAENLVFCSVDRSFWNSEIACARRISAFNLAAFASGADMMLKLGSATKDGAFQVMKSMCAKVSHEGFHRRQQSPWSGYTRQRCSVPKDALFEPGFERTPAANRPDKGDSSGRRCGSVRRLRILG